MAPLRKDWLTVDIDRCADQVLSHILDAGDEFCARLAHLAASGSPDSLHVAFVCPSASARAYLIERIGRIRELSHLQPGQAVDVLTERRVLRLPGSISLKGFGFCRPVDTDGRTITALAAAQRVRQAIASERAVESRPVIVGRAEPDRGRPLSQAEDRTNTEPVIEALARGGAADGSPMRHGIFDVKTCCAQSIRRSHQSRMGAVAQRNQVVGPGFLVVHKLPSVRKVFRPGQPAGG